MELEREALIHDTWKRVRHEAMHAYYKTAAWRVDVTPLLDSPLMQAELNSREQIADIIEFVHEVRRSPSTGQATGWRVICEGIVVEMGSGTR